MFKFLRTLLKTADKKEIIELPKDELAPWIDEQIIKKKKAFEEKAILINKSIKDKISLIKELLEELEDAELQNKNVSTKEIQFMEGNRNSYIKNTRTFLKNVPKVYDADFIEDDFKKISEELIKLGSANKRNFAILQHFFANETREISIQIKNIEMMFVEMHEFYIGSSLKSLIEAKENLGELDKKEEKIHAIKDEINMKRKGLQKVFDDIEKLEKEKELITSKKEFISYTELEEKKKIITTDMKRLCSDIDLMFSAFEQPLKKYVRIALDKKIVEQFLDSPSKTVLSEDNEKILEMLSKLKANIEDDSIQLKDKKKEKALSSINSIDRENLEKFISNYSNSQNLKVEIERELQHNDIMRDYTELNYKLEHLKTKKEKLEDGLDNLDKTLSKNDDELSFEQILEKLNITIKKRISII